MSLDQSARSDINGYDGPQSFVDKCSFPGQPGIDNPNDVFPTRTIHAGPNGAVVNLVPSRFARPDDHTVRLESGVRIIIADAARATATSLRMRYEPIRSMPGYVLVGEVEGLDGDHPRVTETRDFDIGTNDTQPIFIPPRGLLKVISETWRREPGVSDWVEQLDPAQLAEYMLGRNVHRLLMTHGQ